MKVWWKLKVLFLFCGRGYREWGGNRTLEEEPVFVSVPLCVSHISRKTIGNSPLLLAGVHTQDKLLLICAGLLRKEMIRVSVWMGRRDVKSILCHWNRGQKLSWKARELDLQQVTAHSVWYKELPPPRSASPFILTSSLCITVAKVFAEIWLCLFPFVCCKNTQAEVCCVQQESGGWALTPSCIKN